MPLKLTIGSLVSYQSSENVGSGGDPPKPDPDRLRTFTRKARRTVINAGLLLRSYADFGKAYFLTLTVPVHDQDDRFYTKQLSKFLENLRKRHGMIHYLWRAERQKRGAIHFHIIFVGDRLNAGHVRKYWQRLLNVPLAYIKIVPLYDNGAVFYCTKYAGKLSDDEVDVFTCRTWGMSRFLRKCSGKLPVDESIAASLTNGRPGYKVYTKSVYYQKPKVTSFNEVVLDGQKINVPMYDTSDTGIFTEKELLLAECFTTSDEFRMLASRCFMESDDFISFIRNLTNSILC